MALFKDNNKKSAYRKFLPAAALLLILVVFVTGVGSVSKGSDARQLECLETALSQSITTCYAIEGVYPESLEYIKENYGLVYDESRFYVDYRVQGANITPEFTIIRLEGESN